MQQQLTGLSEKIFLDRYAWKDADTNNAKVGDVVLVLTKDDPKFPTKEVGEIVSREGKKVTVRTRSGEMVQTDVEKLTLNIEKTPEEMWNRLAQAMASVEKTPELQQEWRDKFRSVLDDWKLVPGGRIAAGAGASDELTLFNCYVIPSPKDSRGGIMETLTEMTEIMARGGGVGINLSSLRPRRAIVKGVNGSSSGAVSWGGLFSYTTGLIEQGGCFGPRERIATNRGLIPASELADRLDRGETLYALTHWGPRRITHSFRNGVKPLFRVTTERGFTVEVTKDHKMGAIRNGSIVTIPLQDLDVRDETLLLLAEGLQEVPYVQLQAKPYNRSEMSTTLNEAVKLPKQLDEQLAYLLGYFYGDGYVHWGRKVNWEAPKAIKLATADDRPEIRQCLIEILRELFNIEPVVEKGDGACQNVALYSRIAVDWLEQNQILKARSAEIRVPEPIFRSPASVMGAFVAGYFDADGCDRGAKGGHGIDSVSLGMLRDVQQLLAVNGIMSHIRSTDRSGQGWRTIYRLCVTGAEFKDKMSRFIELSLKNEAVPGKYYQGVWDATKARISFRALTRVKDRLQADGQVALAERVEQLLATVPDRIMSIEPIGPSEVFDFEVEDVHMLCGNGFYTSNSRRGALMLMMNDWHPDVLDFITVKQTMGQVTNANLSVCVSNGFMKAVKEDLDWELVFPDTSTPDYDELWDGDLDKWKQAGRKVVHYRTVKAREIWHTIIESAWKSAEPGVVFMEYYNQMSNSWYFNPIICTNPCFHLNTRITTEYGLITIEDLYKKTQGKAFLVGTDLRLVEQAKVVGGRSYEVPGLKMRTATVFPTGQRETLNISLQNGMELSVTPEHRLYTNHGWKEAAQLSADDYVYLQSGEGKFAAQDALGEEWGLFLGWLTGDGWISKRGDVGMVFGAADSEVIPQLLKAGEKITGVTAKVFERSNGTKQVYWWRKALVEQLYELGVKAVRATEKEVPSALFTSSRTTVTAFLQALFSADGTVNERDEMHRTARLTSASRKLLQGVQLLLLNYGINSSIYEHKVYSSSGSYELIVSGNNLVVFAEKIGFKFVTRKQRALERIARPSRKSEKFASKVNKIEKGDFVTVYDIHEPETNSLIAGGMVAHNCGEQGLPGWGVCNLSAINLSKFYDEERHDVDWEELALTTRYSVRFLDNVIDKTPYHFAENEQNQKKERRVGLGTMGLAELMIKLNIRYGSPESLEFLDKLYGFMAREAYLASADIAAEKGSFQAFDAEKYVLSGFMKNMIEVYPEVGEAVAAKGMRNVTVITQAPTGSTGTMVGTSTGIEPYFAFKYFRQSRLGFDEQFVPIAQEWLDAHPGEKLPDYFVTAMDLSAEDHIRAQAAIQRWVDSSISKTANCPADFTVEETKKLYELAFDLGCKGVTIYRDGSRDVQVLSTEKKDEGTAKESVPAPATAAIQPPGKVVDKQYKSRPQVLRGATYKINTPFGMAYITINDLNGIPAEIFLNVGKAGSDVFAMAEALGRVCSLFLRYGDHGHKVELLVKHLKGIGGSGAIGFGVNRVESIADAVAKALELHVQNGIADHELDTDTPAPIAATLAQEESMGGAPAEQVNASLESNHGGEAGTGYGHQTAASRDLCPSCGSASLINIEGCKTCSNCGYSKCG
ncbi:LAGLIDADG family homing endonuclease [Paenibacillus enshidis]|uniref:Vitamin B12-dependent ribonucleotide reductase n=1 Tax=Paenibacillus enshidis TaxID=1458439 RepID=A0ABV5AQE8_9BACL